MIARKILQKLQKNVLHSTICPRINFSVWKAPTDYEVERAKFPTPKEIFPKENPAAYTTLNDLTPSLFKNVQGFKDVQPQRAAYMQFAKPNGEIYHIFDASKIV